MKGKYSALTVAKWFLWYNDKILEEEDADLISNAQKMTSKQAERAFYVLQGMQIRQDNPSLEKRGVENAKKNS